MLSFPLVLKLVKLAKGVSSLLDTLFEALPQVCFSLTALFEVKTIIIFVIYFLKKSQLHRAL